MSDATSPTLETGGSSGQATKKRFNVWKWFWISVLVISLGWAWHDFYVPENKVGWVKDYAWAQQESAKSGKPILLFFTGTWCVPCRVMKREVLADKEVEAILNSQFTPLIVDADDPKSARLVEQYKIGFTPITVITDAKGTVLKFATGGLDKKHFLELLSNPVPPPVYLGK